MVTITVSCSGKITQNCADLSRRRLGDPFLANELSSFPPAPAQVEQPQLGDVLGAGVQAAEALLASGREGGPADVPDAERVEQPGPQVAGEGHPRVALDDAGQRVRAGLAVGEDGAGLAVRRDQQEPADRLVPVPRDRFGQHLPRVTGGHRRDMPDFYRTGPRISDLIRELGEVGDDRVVQVKQPFGLRERGRGGSEALAQRVQQVRPSGAVGRPPAFGHDVPVRHHHQAVQLDVGSFVHRVQESSDRGWIDPLIRWRAAWQGTRHDIRLESGCGR
ncbi:MAG: hypothetical protein ABSB59_35405 [Streptosporangiaceae bacterium]